MLTNFGWKAVLGIVISNMVYFFVFRKEMAELDKKYAMASLEDEIQEKYLTRSVMNARFEKVVWDLEREGGTLASIDEKVRKIAMTISDQAHRRIERSMRRRVSARRLIDVLLINLNPYFVNPAQTATGCFRRKRGGIPAISGSAFDQAPSWPRSRSTMPR